MHFRELVSLLNFYNLNVSMISATEISIVILIGDMKKGCADGYSVYVLSLHHKQMYYESRRKNWESRRLYFVVLRQGSSGVLKADPAYTYASMKEKTDVAS